MPLIWTVAAGLLATFSYAYDEYDYRQYRREISAPPAIHYINQASADQYMRNYAPAVAPPYQPPYNPPPPAYNPGYNTPPQGFKPPLLPGQKPPIDRGGPREFHSASADGTLPTDGSFKEFSDTFADKVKAYVAKHARGGSFLIKDEASGMTRPLRLIKILPATISQTGPEAVGCAQFETIDTHEPVDLDFHLTREDWEWSIASLSQHAAAPAAQAAAPAPPGAAPKAKAPARLSAEVAFTEPSGNQRLDGGETAAMVVKISNAGPGPAYDVRVAASARPAVAGLEMPEPALFGNLKAGQSATRELKLQASDSVVAARAAILLEVKEANGFDGDPIVVEFETRPFLAPKLELAGLAVGGSGVVKAGESTPLTVTLRNTGVGSAEGVTVTLVPGSSDIFLSGEPTVTLGAVTAGQSIRAEFEFFVKKRYQGTGALPLAVTIKESRGRYGLGPQNLGLVLGQAAPSLRVAYKGKDAPTEVRNEAADVDIPPAAETPQDPEAFAVVIGVEKYRDLPSVDYAARDAQSVRTYLTEAMGFLPSNVVLLQNERATLTDLATYLGPWLKDRVKAKSRVFVYYSGHGAPDPKTGESYLVPYDGNPQYAETKAFPVRKLYESLAALPTKDVIVALDSCFSGVGARSVIAKGTRPLVSVKAAPSGANTVILTASGNDQVSGSYPEGQHGLLTYFMLKGLQGAADLDRDSQVTTAELFRYLRPAVEEAARRQHVEQTPTLTPSPEDLGSRGRRVWLKRS